MPFRNLHCDKSIKKKKQKQKTCVKKSQNQKEKKKRKKCENLLNSKSFASGEKMKDKKFYSMNGLIFFF